MDQDRARRVSDRLPDRGIDARLARLNIDRYAVRVLIDGGPEAVWGAERMRAWKPRCCATAT